MNMDRKINEKVIVPILAGGGTRLPAHVGILKALQKMDIGSEHIVGVSGGSIVASLWAKGWSIESMKQLSLDVKFSQFREFNIRQLLFHGGLSSGDHFENWMDEQLNGAAFKDLQRELHIVATDVRTGTPVIFDKQNTPDFSVSTAVRYSMGIPLLFAFKEYRDHLMTDGSILSEDALRQDWTGRGTPTCCFRLRANKNATPKKKINKWFPLPDYMQMLIRAFMTTLSREFINDAFWSTTITVDTDDVSPVEFDLTMEQKMLLMNRGFETTMAILPMKFPTLAPLIEKRATG